MTSAGRGTFPRRTCGCVPTTSSANARVAAHRNDFVIRNGSDADASAFVWSSDSIRHPFGRCLCFVFEDIDCLLISPPPEDSPERPPSLVTASLYWYDNEPSMHVWAMPPS